MTESGRRQRVRERGFVRERRYWSAWLLLAVALGLTALAWRTTLARVNESQQVRLDQAAQSARDTLLRRTERYQRALEAVRGAYLAVQSRQRSKGTAGLESIAHETILPGLRSITLVREIPAGDELASKQADTPAAGRGVAPFAWSKELARAAEHARDSAELAIGPVTARPSPVGDEVGFWTFLPVYRDLEPAGTLAARRASIWGWLTAFVPAADLMRGLDDIVRPPLDLELFDGPRATRRSLVYDLDGWLRAPEGPYATDLRRSGAIQVGGRIWMVYVTSPALSELPLAENPADQVLLGGLVISFLLFGAGLIMDRKRANADRVTASLAGELRRRQALLEAVVERGPDAILVVDEHGAVESFSAGAERLFGYQAAEAVGLPLALLLPGGVEAATAGGPQLKAWARHDLSARRGRPVCGRRQDGTPFQAEVWITRLRAEDAPRFAAIVRELGGATETELAIEAAKRRNVLSAHATSDGLWEWDLEGHRISYSVRWKAMLGYSEEEIGDSPEEWLERVHPEDQEALRANLASYLEGRSSHFECEYRALHRDGSCRWMLTRGAADRNGNGEAARMVGSQTDITARKRAEIRLLHAVLHDPLTDLPNRAHFMERLETASRRARLEPQYRFALLFLDVDRFQLVNEGLGHLAGDELLISIARRLQTCLPPGATIARLGGDEFAVLLEGLDHDKQAMLTADRLQKKLALPHHIHSEEIFIEVSIGIALNSAGDGKPGELLRQADVAMHRAKALGRARSELFDHEMHQGATQDLHLETALRRALERNELEIHYQPIVSLASGEMTSCEALLRWRHPERGMILPLEFIPAAEQSGLINPISAWLLRTACGQAKAWHEAGLPPVCVSVNVSPRFVQSSGFFEAVMEALGESGLDPALLQLELTESALMENADSSVKPLVELYTRGVQVSLDDFGTGYSSLVYLRRYPISALKIDESLVREITTDPGDAAIASGLIALAHSLDLRVIVEGVETREQLAFLQSKKCDGVQGFIISPPLEAEAFAQLLQERGDLEALLARRAAAAHG